MGEEEKKFYLVDCKGFSSILAFNLTDEELKNIQNLRQKLSFGEYSSYSPEEQQIRRDIEAYIKKIGKFLPYETTIIDLFN